MALRCTAKLARVVVLAHNAVLAVFKKIVGCQNRINAILQEGIEPEGHLYNV